MQYYCIHIMLLSDPHAHIIDLDCEHPNEKEKTRKWEVREQKRWECHCHDASLLSSVNKTSYCTLHPKMSLSSDDERLGGIQEELAERYLAKGEAQRALEAASKAVETNPQSWRAWALKGRAAMSFEGSHLNMIMAVGMLKKALSLMGPDVGERQETRRLYELAREKLGLDDSEEEPEVDVSGLVNQAEYFLSIGKETNCAFELCKAATLKDPANSKAWLVRAMAQRALTEEILETNRAAEYVCLEKCEQNAEIQARMTFLRDKVSPQAISMTRDFALTEGIPGAERYRLQK